MTNLRSGFPLTFGSALTNYLPGFGSGGIRPNVVPGCSKAIGGAAKSRLNEYFNTNCFVAPGVFSFGDESRNDSQLRAPGIDNWDFGLFKTIPIKDRINAAVSGRVFQYCQPPSIFSPRDDTRRIPHVRPDYRSGESTALDPVQFALELLMRWQLVSRVVNLFGNIPPRRHCALADEPLFPMCIRPGESV